MEVDQNLKYRQAQFLKNNSKCYLFLTFITLSVCLLIANIGISFNNNFFRSMMSTSVNLQAFYCDDTL